jgi:hypothetical protein
MNQHLQYINQGRGGTIVYTDDKGTIQLSFEFGGGDCVVIIFVPTPSNWNEETGRPASERTAVLSYIAEQCIRDQAPHCYFQLSDNWIEIFRKPSQATPLI